MTPFRLVTQDRRPIAIHIGDTRHEIASWENMGWWRQAVTDTGKQITLWAASGKGCVSVGLDSWHLHNVRTEGADLVAEAEPVDFMAVCEELFG